MKHNEKFKVDVSQEWPRKIDSGHRMKYFESQIDAIHYYLMQVNAQILKANNARIALYMLDDGRYEVVFESFCNVVL